MSSFSWSSANGLTSLCAGNAYLLYLYIFLRATHGTDFLTDEEIVEYYGKDKHWPEFEDLINTVDNMNGN